ncbi:MAG: TrkH family potassium uptake protein [Pararhodobacter sp.]
MPDFRPVLHVIGLLLATFGLFMLLPAGVDWLHGDTSWPLLMRAAFVTALTGALLALATANTRSDALTIRQSFLLTTLTWTVLPAFGAVPFMLGDEGRTLTDAMFESMSGMTTTGTTILTELEERPVGLLLWRSILQWLGGLGIIIVALVFLPVMRVGGMQHFRSEGFDTMGKVLPRVRDISLMLIEIYLGLTIIAAIAYAMTGMGAFDAINHAMTTIATGGYSTRDDSFAAFGPASHYASVALMWLAGLPFIRYIQLVGGQPMPLFRDVQVRAYFRWSVYAIALIVVWRLATGDDPLEQVLRESAFNTVSLFSGTGFATADVSDWGDFALLVVFVGGVIGACTASTGCALKVFRFLVLIEALKAQLRQLVQPNRLVPLHLGGKRLEDDVISSVIVLFSAFVMGFGVLAILLSLTGLEMRTAITASWTAIFNIGPAFGHEVGATGAVDGFPAAAKWLMIVGMLVGRLEMVAVLVLVLPRFWRA